MRGDIIFLNRYWHSNKLLWHKVMMI